MLIAVYPVIVLIIGLLLWLLVPHPVINKAGMIWFAIGSFFTVWLLMREVLKLG